MQINNHSNLAVSLTTNSLIFANLRHRKTAIRGNESNLFRQLYKLRYRFRIPSVNN